MFGHWNSAQQNGDFKSRLVAGIFSLQAFVIGSRKKLACISLSICRSDLADIAIIVELKNHPCTIWFLWCRFDASTTFGLLDVLGVCCCLIGIWFAFIADNQLFSYMMTKNRPIILDTGLWKFSRHPNHFGEQLWWFGLALLGSSCGTRNCWLINQT